MDKAIEYVIKYEHLEIELVKTERQQWHFDQVRSNANKYKLELSDKDFERLFRLQIAGIDMGWIMHKMNIYNQELVDVLVSYITY